MDDKVLISQLSSGLNIHDENTKTFFEIEPSDDRWSTFRAISKIIQFGRLFYGGSDRGIYSKVRTAAPDSGLSFSEFVKAVSKYFEDHPDFAEFVDSVQRLAREERISVNGYGRIRNLYGNSQAISRQALNSPIQGTAADFVSNVIVKLWDRGLGNKYRSYIALQVHDELLFMVYDDERDEVFRIIHEEMTREQEILNYKGEKVRFSVPIDAEVGQNWGTMEGIDLLTGEIKGESKH